MSLDEIELHGALHDIQYQGAATRLELRLDNGQSFALSQANTQWQLNEPTLSPGQTLTVRWPRAAMVALREEA